MWPQAIDAMRRLAENNKGALPYFGFVLARGGHTEQANAIRDTLLAQWQRREVGAYEVGVIHAGLGDYDAAFQWLERSVDDLSFRYAFMQPMFGPPYIVGIPLGVIMLAFGAFMMLIGFLAIRRIVDIEV